MVHLTLGLFNFEHFNLMEISVYSDGQQQYGIKPLATDYANQLYVRAYNTLLSGTVKVFRDEGNAVDRTDFSRGYALHAFHLTPDLGEDDHLNLTKQGSVRLVLNFREALVENVTVIAECKNVIEIDRNRNVIYDFPADVRVGACHPSVCETFRWSVQQRSSTDETQATRGNTDPSDMPGEHWMMWTMMDITENISTRSGMNLLVFLNVT